LPLVNPPAAVLAAYAVEGEDVFVDLGSQLRWEAVEGEGRDFRFWRRWVSVLDLRFDARWWGAAAKAVHQTESHGWEEGFWVRCR
jgi:hypothetical protein